MTEKKKRGRPPGSGKKEVLPYVMTPALESAIENQIAEMPKPPRIKDYEFPSDWDKMGKVERLKWLTANRK